MTCNLLAASCKQKDKENLSKVYYASYLKMVLYKQQAFSCKPYLVP